MRAGRYLGGLLALMVLNPVVAAAGPALLFEAQSGKILYAEDADNLWHPASLTKIMTAYVAFEAIRDGKLSLDDKLVTSELANKEPPSKIGLPVGAEMSVDLALKALIVKSANDVAIMLAEKIGGNVEGFVDRMNTTAQRLGMQRTRFVNPNGLPAEGQVTTARDLAKLSRAVMRDFPQYAELWALSDFQIGKRRLASHNTLLKSLEGADGLKTGFICDSGFNVVASATRDGTRLMAVVLGEQTSQGRSLRASSLLEHGFQHAGWKSFFNPTDIDNMPLDENAKSAVSMRETVKSWGCGYRPAKAARAATRVRKLKQRAKPQNKTQHQQAAKPHATTKAAASATATHKPASSAAAASN